MSWLIFLYTVLFQMKGEYATDNIWWDAFFDQMLLNQITVQSFFGWLALILVILWIVLTLVGRFLSGSWKGACSLGCLIYPMIFSVVLWIVGFLQIYLFGYLAAHFSPEVGALPGFWPVAFIVAWISLAR
jgi:hypothetical protein